MTDTVVSEEMIVIEELHKRIEALTLDVTTLNEILNIRAQEVYDAKREKNREARRADSAETQLKALQEQIKANEEKKTGN